MRRIGICDKNPEYAIGLTDHLVKSGADYSVVTFTDMDSLETYLMNDDIDLILTDDTEKCSVCREPEREVMKFHNVRCIYMSETRDFAAGDDRPDEGEGKLTYKVLSENMIFKYQNLRSIDEKIRRFLAPKVQVRRFSTVEAVFSPLGRCGCTTLAKALAEYDTDGRGLYIGMENYCADRNFSKEILYQLKERFPDFTETLRELIIYQNNINVLHTGRVYQDLQNVQREDLIWMNEAIGKIGNFSSVIYDFGSAVLADFGILDVFDRIYVPVLDDECSERKLECFEMILRSRDYRELLQKLIKVRIPENAGGPEMKKMVRRLRDMKNE